MYDLIKDAIKGISLTLFFLFIGVLVNFDWFFWLLLLFFVLRHFIDPLKYSLDNLNEKLRQYNLKNRPPQ